MDTTELFASYAGATIIATLVPDNYRLAFLPLHFKRHVTEVEAAVYGQMGFLCPGYNVGTGSSSI